MFRLLLVLVLVALTASEKHLKVERRNQDVWETCFGKNYPVSKCFLADASSYPVLSGMRRTRGFDGIKRVLKAEGALKKLCDEVPRFLTCIGNTVKRAPEECQEKYKHYLWVDASLDKGLRLIEQLCTEENIEIAKRNLDCVVDECILQKLYPCSLKNPDHDCSHLETNDYGPNPARRECYDEMYRRNCDANAVVECAANKVSKACTAEAGRLVTQAGNGFLDIQPICRDGEHKFRTLLKFFK